MRIVGELLADAAARLQQAGIEDGRREARTMLAHVLAVEPASVFAHPERPVTESEADRFGALLARRIEREPWSRIRGEREFWSLTFRLTPDTLDPRPDSETIVQAVLDALPDHNAPLRLLDFGTGSGCLLLALVSELPNAWGLGVDLNQGAARAAAANAEALGFAARTSFIAGDWGASLGGRFDAIIANPPYIPAHDFLGLAPEVGRWDPTLALAGGADGLDAVRALLPHAVRLLAPDGIVGVELGAGQADPATLLAQKAGLTVIARPPDLSGVERCLLMRLAGSR